MNDPGYCIGWDRQFEQGERPAGVHPLACVGGPPESREWKVGDRTQTPLIHPSALINSFVTVDAGLEAGPATRVGARTFVQSKAHIAHNVVVGDDCEICVGVTLCGYVTVGDGARVGGNTWVKPRVTIGAGAIVGGGSVVTRDVPAHEVWCGNPARFLKKAWSHPDYERERVPEDPFLAGDHPYREPEEVWSLMQPFHYRQGMAG